MGMKIRGVNPYIWTPRSFVDCDWINRTFFGSECKIKRYIINEGATILFWDDNTKTISKRHEEDEFDKELGFLYAYFYKKWGKSKTSRKKVLQCIKEDKIKDFLFEFYVKDTKQDKEKARKYLSNLDIAKK